jgi:hypothetical protein
VLTLFCATVAAMMCLPWQFMSFSRGLQELSQWVLQNEILSMPAAHGNSAAKRSLSASF